MTMMPFHTLYPDIAGGETRCVIAFDDPVIPIGEYLLDEAYCIEERCDCRRVMIAVIDAARREQVATINHGFEPPEPPFEDEGQTFLDPLNPQSELSTRFLEIFEHTVATDPAYRERLERHYTMWKKAVDDPKHPFQETIRRRRPARPGGGFFPPRGTVRREAPKIGANAPCPCGSGKKFKKCCQRAGV